MRAFFMADVWFKLVMQLTVKQAPPPPLARGLKIPTVQTTNPNHWLVFRNPLVFDLGKQSEKELQPILKRGLNNQEPQSNHKPITYSQNS